MISVSDQQSEDLPTLTVKLSGRETLWGKTKKMFLQTDQLARNYDWVLKADDDTFIFMENLKAMLSHFNSSSALIAGALWVCRGNGDCQAEWSTLIGPDLEILCSDKLNLTMLCITTHMYQGK